MRRIFLLFLAMMSLEVMAQDALWLRYPSISPDGKTIVFSYKGDIFKVSAQGGLATPLTVHSAFESYPIWSPDGKTIAFASDRNGNFDIYTIPVQGGQAQRVTFHSNSEIPNSFTPDGARILFNAVIQDDVQNVLFPSGVQDELYAVPTKGGRTSLILSVSANDARLDKAGKKLIFHNRKGYENIWRKHHTSSIARDLMMYDLETKKYTYLTDFEGEDRNPVYNSDESEMYYLSEKSGSFNVHKMSISDPSKIEQITKHEKHPVRFLSLAQGDKLCYSFDGQIYTKEKGAEPKKLSIQIPYDFAGYDAEFMSKAGNISEMEVSPDGQEIAFIIRGEVYVTSTEYNTTKRITNTAQQERSVSFSPDGRAVLYAGERNGSWNLYQTKLVRKEDKHFYNALEIKEEAILESAPETFQPAFSPDGKEVAYLHERMSLKVIDLKTKAIRDITTNHAYSYADGDQWYQWSPDGKWFLIQYEPSFWFNSEIGLVSAQGGKITNLTQSGYGDARPIWENEGKMILWMNDKYGYRSHGSWGSQDDVFGMFFNQEDYNIFKMNKEEYEIWKDSQKKDDKKDDKSQADKKDKKGKSSDSETKKEELKPLKINLEGIEDRKVRLTIHSNFLGGAILDKDASKLYYLAMGEKGFDLWEQDFREKKTKLLIKMNARSVQMTTDSKKEHIFLLADGSIKKIKIGSKDQKSVSFSAPMNLDRTGERQYMFEHAWRQVVKKFYDPKLHGVDWDFYKKEYAKFLPHINNNYDYAEMLSELLGELNGSHTGSGYRHQDPKGDQTSTFGALFDWNYEGSGLKIAEVLDKSPLLETKQPISEGMIIEKINHQEVKADADYFALLNRLAGEPTLLTIFDPTKNKRFEEVIKPISFWAQNNLLYERWVKQRRADVEKYSKGRLGYVHVRGMNSASFREVYAEVMGRYADKEAIVIDTRFNGGGWLHDDLATFFRGETYVTYSPRGNDIGTDPFSKWTKPSILLVSESNYSDAHAFPYVYQTLKIGKIVGMPVPGTMTAVWWETLLDNSLYFGIPQVGAKDRNGNYLENQQLEPDVKVNNEYEKATTGEDQQLQKAVETLLKDLGNK